ALRPGLWALPAKQAAQPEALRSDHQPASWTSPIPSIASRRLWPLTTTITEAFASYMPMAVRYTQPTLPLTSYLIRYQSPRRPVTETRVPCSTRATTAPSRLADERTRATSQATVA